MSFRKIEAGIRRCDIGRLVLLTMNLAELGEQRPTHLINLFSSRHRKFTISDKVDRKLLAAIRHVYQNIYQRDEMKHADVRPAHDENHGH